MRERWKVSALWLVLSVLLCPGRPGMAGESPEEEQVVERLQRNYDSSVDFAADFRQETEIKALNRQLKAWGKVYFKRPGRMLWRYDEPKDQWVLADGKSFYFYQPEQKQIIKTPLQSLFRSDIPLSFLLGIGNLRRDFKVTPKGRQQGHYLLHLEPKAEPGAIGEIHLGVDSRAFDILWARIRDAVGNVTTIRFSQIRKGLELKDSLFELRVPDGVDLVELGS